ncbi:MAG: YfcC family protein [Acidobacteriota bacterium]|nr:YfcC family protein [Acidobacteriota bacterium]
MMRFQLPHPFVLLLGAVGIAATLTWIIPAGEYQRRTDADTGRTVVIAGTYAPVDAAPVGPMAAVLAVPRGIIAGADVILTILFVGGAFALLDATGALARLVGALVGATRRPRAIVVALSLGFATLGALENMQEEIVALTPVLILLSRGLGFGSVTAVAMSIGAAAVGAAFGPTNPFQTGIALRFAELPGLTLPSLRFGLLAAAVATWIAWTLAMASRDDVKGEVRAISTEPATRRDGVLLALVLLPFVPYVYGVLQLDWGFNELSALFLVAGFAVGLVSGRDLTATTTGFLKGMEVMLAAGLFVGVARAISVVMTDGRIIDTILYSLAVPLAQFPGTIATLMMVPVHAVLHLAVPSVSGQAVLTMPIMAPLSDLLGVSRDAAVIAYQTGAGLSDMLVPTNGAVLAVLLSAGVPYGRWLRFAVPGVVLVGVIGAIGIVLSA